MSFLIARLAPPILLGALLLLQVVHGYVNWVRYHGVVVYSGAYVFQEKDKLFLPFVRDMKRLLVQLGAQEAIGLTDQNVDVVVVQDVLRVAVRPKGRGDWDRVFARFDEEVSRVMVSNWKRELHMGPCTCVSPVPLVFQGWSASRESWIKPLDLVSVTVLAIAFVGSLTGREAGWKR